MALCAGIGGLELGLEITLPEYRCVCYVEREAYPAAVLVSRMAEGALDEAPIWDDLETFDGRPWRGIVDIISAGFPCQPWSTAGEQKGTDDDRWLWPAIARILRHVRPRYIFLENVPNLVNGGPDPILCDLAGLGYDATWDVFSAFSVGAPHIRKRLFLLAHADGGRLPRENLHVRKGGQEQDQIDAPRCGQNVANPNSKGLLPSGAIGSETPFPFPKSPGEGCEWWLSEPDMGRVADGVAHKVDRIRAIGNAVVPGVAAVAFRVLESRFR